MATIPGVEAASGANAIPFNPERRLDRRIEIAGAAEKESTSGSSDQPRVPRLLRSDRDSAVARPHVYQSRPGRAPLVAVIDEELARRYFPGEEPLGKLIGSAGSGTGASIIGVVGSVHNSDLGGPREPEVYFPELQERTEATYLVLRTKGDVDPTGAVRKAIAKFHPGAALFDVRLMDQRVADSLRLRRFVAFLLNGLAVTGMLLAVVGLYASLAHSVELRQREIGIRVALGARQFQIVRMILARAGIVVGLRSRGGSRRRGCRGASGRKSVVWRAANRCGGLGRCARRNADGGGDLSMFPSLARGADRPVSRASRRVMDSSCWRSQWVVPTKGDTVHLVHCLKNSLTQSRKRLLTRAARIYSETAPRRGYAGWSHSVPSGPAEGPAEPRPSGSGLHGIETVFMKRPTWLARASNAAAAAQPSHQYLDVAGVALRQRELDSFALARA